MGEEPKADPRVVSRVVGAGGEVLAHVTERVRALRGIAHPGVLTPEGLAVADGDQVVVRFPWVEGMDLAELETRRGPLSAAECVWLGVRVAQALEHMHAQGLAHGDISPGNVVLTRGTVMLVDTVAGCLADERGTVGFRAPERESHGPSVAGDVFSLGALLRWCVASDDRMAIEAWTEPLLVRDPHARPPVEVARRALVSCAKEQEVAVPAATEVVTAVRARAADRTVRIEPGRSWRWRRLGLRVGLGVAVAGAVCVIALAVPRLIDTAEAADPGLVADMPPQQDDLSAAASTESPREPVPEPSLSPREAAVALTEQRFRALATGDAEQLLATVGEGKLADEVKALSSALDAGDVRYDGLGVRVGDVEVVAEMPNSAIVHVAYDVSEHVVVTQTGQQPVAAHTQEVELELSWDGAWTVQAARPTP